MEEKKEQEEKKEERTMNIYEKILAVSNEIKSIEKNMTVGKGANSYKAVSDIDVVTAVKKAETKYKIVSIPYSQELVKSEVLNVAKGDNYESVKYVDIVKMITRIVDVENPEHFVEIVTFGRGLDTADKGFGKASTYARKYALLNAYKIATGEDPDKDKSQPDKVVKKDEKREIVFNYLMQNNELLQKWLQFYNVGCMDDFGDKEISTMYTTLKKRGAI